MNVNDKRKTDVSRKNLCTQIGRRGFCVLRACSVSFSVRIFAHDFVGDKEKIRRHTLCLARIFDAASGEICRKDVRKKMRNRLLVFVFCNDLHGDILSGASGVHGVFFNVAMRRFLGHLLFDNEQTFGT